MTQTFTLIPGRITLADLRRLAAGGISIALDPAAWKAVDAAAATVARAAAGSHAVYGVNTGFGRLAKLRIPPADVEELQRRIVLSHCVGTGDPLPDTAVRLVLALKINALALGYSGVRQSLINALCALYNADVLPVIPAKGSVGASGDLAPLAHLSAVLFGTGEARHAGRVLPAAEGLARAGLAKQPLAAKEGLALLNGTQVSTALAAHGLFQIEAVFAAALVAGAMSVDAALGSDVPFDPRIHAVRGHPGQIDAADALAALLKGSQIRASHLDCDRVQDPYSLRCQPQVMGAALDLIRFAAGTIAREANAVSDNPLVFAESGAILSGGNFHGEPIAFAADILALAVAEIGALSERRTALLTDSSLSSLPAFLVAEPGLNSGFMIAQVTAAALASENKSLAHPASVDSLPTSANQEDHVSMATFAARRLGDMSRNSADIVAIELLAAAQGVDMRKPLTTSPKLALALRAIRAEAAFLAQDRPLAPDIAAIRALIESGWFRDAANVELPSA
ncbi:MAG: histidine ammonia-lyase [Proteobacteria bacterium]|nr:histidine ammonia-lyase [Pseudomonadota bacterium]